MYANVLIDRSNSNIDKTFTYKIPTTLISSITIGKRVLVPFGAKNEKLNGYVISISNDTIIKNNIKEIIEVIDDFPLFDLGSLRVVEYIRKKYMCNFIDALNVVIPTSVRSIEYKSTQDKYVIINDKALEYIEQYKDDKRFNNQLMIINFLNENGPTKISVLKEKLNITNSSIKALYEKDIINIDTMDKKIDIYSKAKEDRQIQFSTDQLNCINIIKEKISANKFKEILIHGVTSSGKTEVYIECVKEVIRNGKQAIILVPEIALTPQIVRRFKEHFGDDVVVTHSQLSNTEKYIEWNRVRKKEVKVMIGPRSAIFAPFDNLGLIVIDEEHEMTYKSENTPKYDAKEIARYRCKEADGIVVYGSATPSIETYYRAKQGEIDLIELKKRVNNVDLPVMQIVDMKKELRDGNTSILSKTVSERIRETIDKKEQVVIFMNRRGYSTFVSCRKCGHVMKCDSCDMPYVYHYREDILVCHHCGKTIKNVNLCPVCNSKYIKFFGIGTEKVENELTNLYKNAKILRMDADTTTKKNSHDQILTEFNSGNADILIGTQMIAKGHDFRNVSLVVIIAADISLNIQDYRAYERAFQLFTQVAGRAGRSGKPGEVFIQTYEDENYVLNCVKNNDYKSFYETEIAIRDSLFNPPFSNIFSIVFIGENEKNLIIYINRLKKYLEYYNIKSKGNFKILGPSSMIVRKINNKYRWRILVKHEDGEKLKKFILYSLDKFNKKEKMKDIKVQLDINSNM